MVDKCATSMIISNDQVMELLTPLNSDWLTQKRFAAWSLCQNVSGQRLVLFHFIGFMTCNAFICLMQLSYSI